MKNLLYHYRTWRIRRYGMGRASIPFILAHTNVLGWWWNLHSYRFAPIVFLWFASVRLINRSWLDYHSHYTSSLIMIEGFIFNVYIYIIQLWVTFNNLLLLLVHITAAICSLIFLYAWVSVSVHGGGEMMPLTYDMHGVTRPDRPGILATAHNHCQISQVVTQGANCPNRSSPPITWLLSDWDFTFPDPGGFRVWVPSSLLFPLIHTALPSSAGV